MSSRLSHRLVGTRTVDLRNRRAHRAKVRRELTAMVDDVEKEAPRIGRSGFVHHFLPLKDERNFTVPVAGGQRLEFFGGARVLRVVRREHVLDGCWSSYLLPLERPFLQAVGEDALFAYDQPGNLASGSGFRIGPVGRILRDSRDDFARRVGFLVPELQKKRLCRPSSSPRACPLWRRVVVSKRGTMSEQNTKVKLARP